jgi:hypothetical protein
MSETIFTKYGGVKPYLVMLCAEHRYTKFNLPFEQGHAKDPKETVTLEAGTVLYSQENPFTDEQISEVKNKYWHHQWGFGPAYEEIPFEKIKFCKLDVINL